jgi:probable phosphoglycerate mutase
MPRAIETAEILAPALGGLSVVSDCTFCENHPGEGDGMSWDEFTARFPAPDAWDPSVGRDPGGESWDAMAARVSAGLDMIVSRHPGELVVVACHGGVIVQSMFRWLGLDPGGTGRAWISPANASLTEWRFGANPYEKDSLAIELVRYNDHSHLGASVTA